MMRKTLSVVLVWLLCLPLWVGAVQSEFELDPEQEARFRELTKELRCPKCQNQSIFDSNAGVAGDLRREIIQQIKAGRSDQEIIDYMVARYGDFVRYRPVFDGRTAILWIGPFVLMAVGAGVLVWQIRKRRRLAAEAQLDEAHRARVAALLRDGEEGRS